MFYDLIIYIQAPMNTHSYLVFFDYGDEEHSRKPISRIYILYTQSARGNDH